MSATFSLFQLFVYVRKHTALWPCSSGNQVQPICEASVSSLLQIFSFQSTWAEYRRTTHSWTQTPCNLYFGVCMRSTDAPRWRWTICQRTAWVHGSVMCLHMDRTCCAVAELMRAWENRYFLSENLFSKPFLRSQGLFITRSQEPRTWPDPGLPESSQCPRILFILRIILVLSHCPCHGIWSGLFRSLFPN